MRTCKCGCGTVLEGLRARWVSGHNLRRLKRTPAHRAAIAAAQRRVWRTKRKRLPIGSKQRDHDGYVRVKVLPGKGRWALEHVLVVEASLGRKLRAGECVHHVNGDRADNQPANLYVCRDRAHHNEVHRSQDRAFRQLLAAGLVMFANGRYETVLRG